MLAKAAEKYLADWLKPVSREQDDRALALASQINFIACLCAFPVALIKITVGPIAGYMAIALLPQLIVLNLANLLVVVGKKRTTSHINPKDYALSLFTTALMYADLFLLINQFAHLQK